jgi:REP-associated tyrosine transposase
MARPLRIEYEGALYHVTSRGNARQDVFLDDEDRQKFLQNLAHVVERFDWICHAYCLMNNHYHLLIETPRANLSQGMQLLNSMLSQRFNRRHKRVGHALQGRFKGILVEKESHLLELARYIVLNPVRAKAVEHPGDYTWSSYRATVGDAQPESLLTVDWILSQFGRNVAQARSAHRQFVAEGQGASVWEALRGGMLLGSDDFVERMKESFTQRKLDTDIVRHQRFPNQRALEDIFEDVGRDRDLRNQRIHEAVYRDGYTLSAIGKYIALHPASLSRIVKHSERELQDARYKV